MTPLWFIKYIDQSSIEELTYRIEIYPFFDTWTEKEYSSSLLVQETIVMASTIEKALVQAMKTFKIETLPGYFEVVLSPNKTTCVKAIKISNYTDQVRIDLEDKSVVEIEVPPESARRVFVTVADSPVVALGFVTQKVKRTSLLGHIREE